LRLPNADRAVVDERKLKDYLLSRSHQVGRFKAIALAAVGIEAQDWLEFREQLLRIARSGDAVLGARVITGRSS